MKLATLDRQLEMSGGQNTSSFRIGDVAKVFSIMSDSMYSDKPLAVVRELICNALDANPSGQFIVSAPHSMSPMFSVKDAGPGISHEFMMDHYLALGYSTKDGDDTAVGGFGVGRMAALAYTDRWTAISITGGRRRTYIIIRGADGIPAITMAADVPTNEPTGFEVQVAIKAADYNTFADKIVKILTWMPEGSWVVHGVVAPREQNWIVRKPTYLLRAPSRTSYGFSMLQANLRVLMGPVAYGVDWSQTSVKLPASIIPIFQVGELSLAPSREALSYDKRTIEVLESRAAEIMASLVTDIRALEPALGKVAALTLTQQLKTCGLSDVFTAWNKANGLYRKNEDGHSQRIPGQGEYFKNSREEFTLRNDVSVWKPSNRGGSISPSPEHLGSHAESYVHHLEKTIFVFHDLTEDRAPRVRERLQALHSASISRYVVVYPSPKIPNLAALRRELDDLPHVQSCNLSDGEVEDRVKAARMKLSVYEFSREHGKWTIGRGGYDDDIWIPFCGADPEDGFQPYRSIGLVTPTSIAGLPKAAQKELKPDPARRLDNYVNAWIETALKGHSALETFDAEETIGTINADPATSALWMTLLRAPDLFPVALRRRAQGLRDHNRNNPTDVAFLRRAASENLTTLPAPKDRTGILPLLQEFAKSNPQLTLLLQIAHKTIDMDYSPEQLKLIKETMK
jgi:hypothetical protein